MEPCRQAARHGAFFWCVVAGTTVFLTLEPALFLVLLALALSGIALFWILLVVRFLALDALIPSKLRILRFRG
ncbi:MAG TPA: hypothetical protein VN812_15995 [Candidatus Acidoferrales bacterium]|nr:hypothetical protein [Candidatus Acidoferrales bacterium]